MHTIRLYNHQTDYQWVAALYKQWWTFGGQYDEARDSQDKLDALSDKNPQKILVAEKEWNIIGTVTIFEDGRAAWLYRFAVAKTAWDDVAEDLHSMAVLTAKNMGHSQLLVYAPVDSDNLNERYRKLWMNQWWAYRAYWTEI